MKRLTALIGSVLLLAGLSAGAQAGPADGFNSDNVEFIKHVPLEEGTATGMRVIDDYMYVTSWKDFTIYDVSDPINPVMLSKTLFAEDSADQGTGFRFENEDVATNGKLLIFAQQLPVADLFVYDMEDKTNPVLLSRTPGLGSHTTDCILDCKFLYNSNGMIIDLSDPSAPKQVGDWSLDEKGKDRPAASAHDVNEVAPGMVLTSSRPIMLLDGRKNPAKPKLVALGDSDKVTGGIHSNRWPNNGTDDFVMFSSETNATGRCDDDNGGFMTWDASKWKKTGTFQLIDRFQLKSGTYSDGSPAVNGLGCSAHWFQEHPTFDNGGLLALGSYEHGTRFVDVSPKGKISEVGYFVPNGGSTSASYWLTDEIVYAVDYSRGIDILRFTGKP